MKYTNKRWEKSKKIGKLNFIFRYGIVYSILASALYLVILHLLDIEVSKTFNFIVILIFIVVGPIWSYFFWDAMEKKYND